MLRYYAIATVLVLGALAFGLLFVHRRPPLRVASVESSGSPSAPRPPQRASFAPGGLKGSAPWALSALPECFHQRFEAHGSEGYVRTLLPRGAQAIAGNAELTVADCRLWIHGAAAEVDRGDVHLLIPPEAVFYLTPSGALAFVRRTRLGAELRVYRSADGTRMRF